MAAFHAPPLPAADLDHAINLVDESLWCRSRGQRIFMTGGTGFVGKWLLAVLLEANRRFELGCEIVVLSRDPDAFRAAFPDLALAPALRLVQGDVRNFTYPEGEFQLVLHAATDVVAASKPLDIFDTCAVGTRRALDFALHARASKFLLVSSGAIYGRQPPDLQALTEDYAGAPDTLSKASAYGEGKRASEWLTSAYAAEYGLHTLTARCFAFVGPYLPLDRQFAIGNFLRDAMSRSPMVIRGDGTPCRSYLHAADMAGWLWKIMFSGAANRAYNVGGTEALSIADLAFRVSAILGSPAAVSLMENVTDRVLPERYVPDTTRIRTELALPEPISLDEAIARTARWHGATF